jgi:formate hydrogenlyase transcriptional activator
MINYGDQAMGQLHGLLERQIQSHFGGRHSIPGEWQLFVDAVNAAYFEFDAERDQLQRSLDLISQELLEASSEVRAIFERLIDSSMDGILAFDRECRFTVWNPALERIFGLNKLQALGKSALDAFPFLKESGSERFYRDALDGKAAVASDRPYILPGTGEQIFMEGRFSPLLNDWGEIIGGLAIFRDVTERKRAEALREEKSRQAALRGDISIAFASQDRLSVSLHTCAEAIVQQLDAAFARIWTASKDGDILELQASAGTYTHLDGPHSRVPVGKFKIGLIAQERRPHLTNDVRNDPRINDRAWAEREGMIAFAGYPLVCGDRLVGVMALFARKALTPDTLDTLASAADLITQGIERKRAEEVLRKSEAYLAEAQRLSHTGSFGWRVASGEIFWSEETFRIFEHDPASCKPTVQWVLERVHPEDVALVQQVIDRARHDGKALDFEHRLLMPDGSIKYVHVVARAVRDGRSELEYVGAVMDITERKRAEAALRERERELQLLIDVVPHNILVSGTDGNPIYVNQGLHDYFGFTLEDVQAKDFRARVYHPDDFERARFRREDAMSRGEGWEVEARILRKDGQYRWFLLRSNPLRDEQGRIIRWYGSGTDIEGLKEAEAALRQRERELQQLIDVVPECMCVDGTDGSVLYANEPLLDYFGLTLEEVQASDFRARTFHPDDLHRVWSTLEDAMSRGIGWEVETRLLRRDGQYRWFLIRSNPLRDEAGRIVRWYSSGTDIEDLKRAEDELRRAQGELQQERDRLKLLLELTNRVVSNLELRDLLRDISASIRQIMHCDAVGVMLPDSESSQLRLYAQDFPDSKGFFKEEMGIPLEGSLPGKAFQTRRAVVAGSLDLAGLDPTAQHAAVGEGVNSFCLLPLTSRGRVLGVVGLARREENGFNQDDVDFLTQVANQVAIAVDNAVAYGQITELKDQLAQEKLYLEDEIRSEHRFEEIIGRSGVLCAVLHQIETVAPTDSTVLIHGETGTGKELVARAIHTLSSRSSNAFVKLNCAAIPTGLLESELFGHEKGAFTGAIAQRIGRFELAHHGTVFLDEIGEIPLELQPKLLRVLQEREFERLGSSRTLRTDARLIAATNRDLSVMVNEQKFRRDLFYRLNVFPIHLPPLRDRQEDIPMLVRHFVQHFTQRMRRTIDAIPSETMDTLCEYHWPGNIRELQNVLERAVILSTGRVLRVPLTELKSQVAPTGLKNHDTLEEAERKHILATLKDTGWVLGGPNGAAVRLAVKRTTLQHRMRRLGISRPGK